MEEEGQQQQHGGALRRRAAVAQVQGGNTNNAAGAEEETTVDSNSCCICHEPWASSGRHRICCIPCGHVYGRSCLELWLARSGGAAAKCLWCGKRFRRGDMINLYGATEHLLDLDHQQQQVASEEGGEEADDDEAARQVLAALDDEHEQQQQQQQGHAAIMDAIGRMNMNNHQQAGDVAAAGGGAVAWKGVEVAWRIERAAAVAVAPGNGEAAVAPGTRAILLLGVILLLFLVCVVLCFIF